MFIFSFVWEYLAFTMLCAWVGILGFVFCAMGKLVIEGGLVVHETGPGQDDPDFSPTTKFGLYLIWWAVAMLSYGVAITGQGYSMWWVVVVALLITVALPGLNWLWVTKHSTTGG